MPSGVYVRTKEHNQKRTASFIQNGRTKGANHWGWKGSGVGYNALHRWVRRNFGEADVCTKQDDTCKGPIEWANKSRKYLRDREDWMPLCASHHLRYDGRERNSKGQFTHGSS